MDSVNIDKLLDIAAALHYCPFSNSFQLGDVIFEVVADSDDGERSSMAELRIVSTNAVQEYPNHYFLANVKMQEEDDDIYQIVEDENGPNQHFWLRFGTEETHSDYPLFLFDWTPRELSVSLNHAHQ